MDNNRNTEMDLKMSNDRKRELSPVLSNIHKKSIHERKKSRNRIQLLKRFKSSQSIDEDVNKNENRKASFKEILNDLENFETDDAADRLLKIKELESERRKFLSDLYVPKMTEESIKIDINNKNETLPPSRMVDNSKNVIANKKFEGFSTGSGKEIVISPENLEKHSELFSDIYNVNEDALFDCNEENDSLPKPNLHRDVSFFQTSITDTQLLLAEDIAVSTMNRLAKNDVNSMETDEIKEKNKDEEDFVGFSLNECNYTKDFCLTFENLVRKIEHKLKSYDLTNYDIGSNSNCFQSRPKNSLISINTVELNSKVASSSLSKEASVSNKPSFEQSQSVISVPVYGSRTALHKPKYISASSLKRAENIIGDINEVEGNSKNTISTNICTVESSPRKSLVAVDENLQSVDNIESKSPMPGFQTASMKPIKMSSASLKRAQDIFNDVCQSKEARTENENLKRSCTELKDELKTNFSTGFATASGRNIPVSAGAWKQAKRIFDDDDDGFKENENLKKSCSELKCELKTNCSAGFTMASGKQVAISENAWNQAERILDDDKDDNSIPMESMENENLKKSCLRSKNQLKTDFSTGFATASGKHIPVSENAWKQAKRILDDDDDESKENENLKKSCSESKHELKTNFSTGFATASGKQIAISENAWNQAKRILDDDKDDNSIPMESMKNENLKNSCLRSKNQLKADFSTGFATANEKNISTSENARNQAKMVLDDDESGNGIPLGFSKNQLKADFPTGFATASGKHIPVSENAWKQAKRILDDDDEFKENENLKKSCSELKHELKTNFSAGFATASGKQIAISENAWNQAKRILDDDGDGNSIPMESMENENFKKSCLRSKNQLKADFSTGFATANEKNISTSENARNQAKMVLDDDESGNGIPLGFSSAGGKPIKISNDALKKTKTIFDEKIKGEDNVESEKSEGEDNDLFVDNDLFLKMDVDALDVEKSKKVPQEFTDGNSNIEMISNLHKSAKKRLGVSRCKQLPVSGAKLKRAKLIFEEKCEHDKDNKHELNNHPQPKIYTSTPLKNVPPNKAWNSGFMETIKENTVVDVYITPVKKIPKTINDIDDSDNSVVIQERTKGGLDEWVSDIDKEFNDLQNRLKIILERKMALQKQKELLESNDYEHRRQRPGILLTKKQSSQRQSLKDLLTNQMPNTASMVEVSKAVLDVSPANAQLIHFNCKDISATITSDEGAVIIPNPNNFVGLSEIKFAFECMPGVESRLLPKAWIANHFKWIVWKLASLERHFPDLFSECLSLENIMQQLKYRYDREIDKAERSALRRILEKDDVPQKRMVLCVAAIIKVSDHMFELELTDGWYSICTSIDKLLSKQIYTSKIKIGTKLIIQCADILDCDGCHPLDVPDHVRLKINYNCTRRAKWDSKLGYQKIPEPFSIRLKTIHIEGGLVGCIKVHIVRVYPLRYMEKTGGKIVWRNKKAEEKRAQEWINQRMKDIEMVQHKVQNDYEKEINNVNNDLSFLNDNNENIKDLNSPRLLCEILENTNDPEGLKNKLSTSQISAVENYKANIYNNYQQEITSRVSEQIKKLKCSERDVTSVLRLRVIDATESSLSQNSFFLSIWKPTEDHLQLLQEECIFSIYNVLPKQNNNLAATTRTHFKRELHKVTKMQRRLLSISEIRQSSKILFNEYDTIGTVVQIHKKRIHHQELWLTDCRSGRVLLVKILDRPEQCCLLDNLSRGQNIVVMNLLHCQSQDNFVQAIANQYTLITSYPQHKVLQDGLTGYCEQLPQYLTTMLSECDKKIELYVSKNYNTTSFIGSTGSPSISNILDDSSEDNTLIPSRLTTTDVAMSLIDMDQYFNNV